MCAPHNRARVNSLEIVHGDIHRLLPFQRPQEDVELMIPITQILETQQLRCCITRVSLIQRRIYILPVEL